MEPAPAVERLVWPAAMELSDPSTILRRMRKGVMAAEL